MIIWRGAGFLVPVIVFASFLLMQISMDAIWGDGYYKSNEWTKTAAIIVAALVIGLLGYFLNYKKRTKAIDEETGDVVKSPAHSLFFIPIEYWMIIVPLFILWVEGISAEQDAKDLEYIQSPVVNDMYLVDYTGIFNGFDESYKYGVMKVSQVSPDAVGFIASGLSYNGKSGPREDVQEGKVDESKYFVEGIATFTISELVELKEGNSIYEVIRN